MKAILVIFGLAVIIAGCERTSDFTRDNNRNPKPELNGGVDGGGGKGIVCRDDKGAIVSAELLDLFEAKAMYGLNIQKSNLPMAQQIELALSRIPQTPRTLVEVYVNRVQQFMQITPSGTELKPIDDSFEVVLSKGCNAEQLANYLTDEMILVSGDIWDRMGETDRAGLILHEAIYAVNRLMGATNSRQSRHVVGRIFDPSTSWIDPSDQIPKNSLTCISPTGPLYVSIFKRSPKIWTLQFQILGRGVVFSKKTVWASADSFDFEEAKTSPILRGEDLIGRSVTMGTTIRSNFEDNDILIIEKRWEHAKDANDQVIRGFQVQRYYLSWTSGTYPATKMPEHQLSCSVELNKK